MHQLDPYTRPYYSISGLGIQVLCSLDASPLMSFVFGVPLPEMPRLTHYQRTSNAPCHLLWTGISNRPPCSLLDCNQPAWEKRFLVALSFGRKQHKNLMPPYWQKKGFGTIQKSGGDHREILPYDEPDFGPSTIVLTLEIGLNAEITRRRVRTKHYVTKVIEKTLQINSKLDDVADDKWKVGTC